MKGLLRIALIGGLVWIVSRSAVYLLPGDPVDFLIHESLVQVDAPTLRRGMDLPDSPFQRIFSMPSGISLIRKVPVFPIVLEALIRSARLTLLTLALSFPFILGLNYLHFRYPWGKNWAQTFSLVAASLPVFIIGPTLLLFTPIPNPWLPALTLALHLSGFWYRAISRKLDGFLPRSPVPGARALGFAETRVFSRALLAPITGSLLAYFGTQLGFLLNGSLVVEVLFQWKGLGSLLAESILSRDYPIIEACLLVATFMTLLSQQLGLWLQTLWEPARE